MLAYNLVLATRTHYVIHWWSSKRQRCSRYFRHNAIPCKGCLKLYVCEIGRALKRIIINEHKLHIRNGRKSGPTKYCLVLMYLLPGNNRIIYLLSYKFHVFMVIIYFQGNLIYKYYSFWKIFVIFHSNSRVSNSLAHKITWNKKIKRLYENK